MKRKSLKSQHGRYLLVFTMRRALAVVQWWCPATSWHTDGGKNRRNISAEIYNAVKMSLFPFPPKVMAGSSTAAAGLPGGLRLGCRRQGWHQNPLHDCRSVDGMYLNFLCHAWQI